MNFRPELAAKAVTGEKTVTRRLVSDNPRSPWWRERCALTVGRDYAVCPGRGKPAIGRVHVVSVRQESLDRMVIDGVVDPSREALMEGFDSFAAFAAAWAAINGLWDGATLVWRVEFEPALSERGRTGRSAPESLSRSHGTPE